MISSAVMSLLYSHFLMTFCICEGHVIVNNVKIVIVIDNITLSKQIIITKELTYMKIINNFPACHCFINIPMLTEMFPIKNNLLINACVLKRANTLKCFV